MIMSAYARELLINAAFRGGSITWPTTYYVGLMTAPPNVALSTVTELPDANGYARVAIANASGQWTAPVYNQPWVTNVNAILFADPTGNWGANGNPETITYVGLFDAATIGTGNLWFYAPIAVKTVRSTDFDPTIPPGMLKLVFDQ